MNAAEISTAIRRLAENVERAFIGKRETIRLTLVAFFAEGHLLLEDVPGVGKTLLGQALARSLNATFSRIQFTSDLVPLDVVGSDIYRPKTQDFEFVPGPIFANVVLADEINRASPRTQSATLEATSERQVTSDGTTRPLPRPFFVVATENPIEFEGTYPLAESQLDRFLMRLSIGYPDRAAERAVLDANRKAPALDSIEPVLSLDEVLAIQAAVRDVQIAPEIVDYLLDVVDATRRSPDVWVGASPRASLAFAQAVRAAALVDGRDYAVPDDVKKLAVPVLAHRLVPKNYRAESRRRAVESIVESVLATVAAPD
ncbi:MAG: MoxR family ATPase [Thermoguttaceae bacterium]|nr:MoxR family ATPase [Thermoguttaceae bacterium]